MKLNGMSIEELRSCLHNMARKIPASKREEFLQLLDDCYDQDDREDSKYEETFQYKKLIPDEKVKEKLSITVDDMNSYVKWLESVIDKRIDGIVGGKY
ncbi:hypothetical protein ACHOLT_17475 [Desulfitobacterium sp. Sab5]|uniref:hypothetical protein n=1 Tax=Desulfitobacterium nosdiversum TaxID=3375356 RepID=UPI003CEC6F51